jgi:hypothetical protein
VKTQTKLARLKKALETIETQEEWDKVKTIVNRQYSIYVKDSTKNKYHIGDRVTFRNMSGNFAGKKIGIIIKTNPKRAKVNVVVGAPKGIWFVPYQNLQFAVKDDVTLMAVERMK